MSLLSKNLKGLLNNHILKNVNQFDFFQLVYLLENNSFLEEKTGLKIELYPVGYDYSPCQEVIRFRGNPSFRFIESDVITIKEKTINGINSFILQIGFMGLYGAYGMLPNHYTETLIERLQKKDYSLMDFLDLFNHRLVSLFYRSWKKYNFYFNYHSNKDLAQEKFKISNYFNNFINNSANSRSDILDSNNESVFHYSSLLKHQIRSPSMLQQILSNYFQVKIKIKQFQGKWLRLEEQEKTRLIVGQYNCLGRNIILGDRIWDMQSKFKINIGPIKYQKYLKFLPNQFSYKKIIELARQFFKTGLSFHFQLNVIPDGIPICVIGKEKYFALGWNIWIKTKSSNQKITDPIFFPGTY